MKSRRQELILQAAAQGSVGTQEQMLDYLRAQGVPATQATVSRDMRELGLRKVTRRGRTVYELGGEDLLQKYRALLAGAVEDVDGAGHMVCVRCAAGMAQSACLAMDELRLEGVVGSLAGEDTVFLLCRGEAQMMAVQEEIRQYVAEFDD